MASFIPSFRDFATPDIINVTPNKIVKNTNDPLDAASIPVVYGLQRITPPRIYTRISDNDPNTLLCVYALSMGECLGVYRLFIDDVYTQMQASMAINESSIPADSTNRTITDTVSTSPYFGVAQFEFLAGNEKAIYDDFFGSVARIDGYNSKLIAQHINNPGERPEYAEDLCLLVATFTYNDDSNSPFNGVPVITVDLFGRRIRSSANVTDTYSNRSYSTNPVECLFDYMTNSNYGCGMQASIFDGLTSGTTWDTARDYCDVTEITTLTNTTLVSNTRYTMNKTINTGNARLSNVLEILKTYLFMMPWINGKFELHAESQGTPEITVNEDSIVDSFRITYPETNTRYNSITYSWQDPSIGFATVRTQYPNKTSTEYTTYLAEDNGNVRNLELSLPGITNPYQAERIAKTYLLKSRLQAKYEFTVFKDFFKYRVGDIVNFSSNFPSVSLLPIRIVKMTVQDDDLILVEAYSHSNSFYTSFPDFVTQTPTYTQPLIPNGGGVVQPGGGGDEGINPPNPGDENPVQPDPGPAPIVPDPDPEPTPVPDYDFNLREGYSLDTIGGAFDKYPYRFYEGSIYTDDFVGQTKSSTTYLPQTGTRRDQNCATHTRFVDGYYQLCMTIVDRTAPGTGQLLAMVYELPNGKYGTCRKDRGTLEPTFYVWDPEEGKDYIDVINTGNATRLTDFNEYRNEYALQLYMDTYRNSSFPALSRNGFYNFPIGAYPIIYPTGAAFNGNHQEVLYERLIRHWLNPTFGRENFVQDASDFTFNYKLYHPVTREYYGSGSVTMGPAQIPDNQLEYARITYFRYTYENYPLIPF